MGLLTEGIPLPWSDAKVHTDHIHEHGITQFLNIWNRMKDRHGDKFLWGDELEYMILSYDDEERRANVSLRQTEVLEALPKAFEDVRMRNPAEAPLLPVFHSEFGRYMVEGVPGAPYGGTISDLLSVEHNMSYRRAVASRVLKPTETLFTLTVFPRLGAPGIFTEPLYEPAKTPDGYSYFLPQETIAPHVRYQAMTNAVRERRSGKPVINVPIFVDANTPRPFVDPTIPQSARKSLESVIKEDHIFLDASGFGAGCCCLQVTFQASDVPHARRVYDALVPIAPIMLALTAASPIWKGYLSNVDCRWDVIAASSDERTEEERGLKPLSGKQQIIPKTRWSSVYSYISDSSENKREYNDTPMPYNEQVYDRLSSSGVDHLLAMHIARLYIRDPLIVLNNKIDQDDESSAEHFESIQSTNWQTIRFKLPPPGSPIGWRVEFRSMEVQLTDFENAAFSVFIILLARAITAFNTNFYIPISKVDENMSRAQRRSAVTGEKFWFRKDVFPTNTPPPSQAHTPMSMRSPNMEERVLGSGSAPGSAESSPKAPDLGLSEGEYEEMSVNEIINGKGDSFPGLLGLIYAYLNTLNLEKSEMESLKKYLDLVKGRANGSLMTMSTWMRNFIHSHPAYAHDSVVSEEINYDLIKTLDQIEKGTRRADGLLPAGYFATRAARSL